MWGQSSYPYRLTTFKPRPEIHVTYTSSSSLSQITEFLESASDGDRFFLGDESGEVRKGDRFIQLSLEAQGVFGGTVTCQSDEVSETATVNVVPGGNMCRNI